MEGPVRRHVHRDLRRGHRLFVSRHLADPASGRVPARLHLRDAHGQRERGAQRLCRRLGQQRLFRQHQSHHRRDRPHRRPQAEGAQRQADRRPGLHPLQLSRRTRRPVLRLQRVRPGPRLRLRRRPDPGRRALQPQLLRQLRHRLVQVGPGHRADPVHLQRERRLQGLSARSATSMSSASPTTASATTTTGTGRSASPPRSMASISPSPTSTPTSMSRTAATP